jgi:hypothetical protein
MGVPFPGLDWLRKNVHQTEFTIHPTLINPALVGNLARRNGTRCFPVAGWFAVATYSEHTPFLGELQDRFWKPVGRQGCQ